MELTDVFQLEQIRAAVVQKEAFWVAEREALLSEVAYLRRINDANIVALNEYLNCAAQVYQVGVQLGLFVCLFVCFFVCLSVCINAFTRGAVSRELHSYRCASSPARVSAQVDQAAGAVAFANTHPRTHAPTHAHKGTRHSNKHNKTHTVDHQRHQLAPSRGRAVCTVGAGAGAVYQ